MAAARPREAAARGASARAAAARAAARAAASRAGAAREAAARVAAPPSESLHEETLKPHTYPIWNIEMFACNLFISLFHQPLQTSQTSHTLAPVVASVEVNPHLVFRDHARGIECAKTRRNRTSTDRDANSRRASASFLGPPRPCACKESPREGVRTPVITAHGDHGPQITAHSRPTHRSRPRGQTAAEPRPWVRHVRAHA